MSPRSSGVHGLVVQCGHAGQHLALDELQGRAAACACRGGQAQVKSCSEGGAGDAAAFEGFQTSLRGRAAACVFFYRGRVQHSPSKAAVALWFMLHSAAHVLFRSRRGAVVCRAARCDCQAACHIKRGATASRLIENGPRHFQRHRTHQGRRAPVLMWLIWSPRPACSTAATESPPPTMVMAPCRGAGEAPTSDERHMMANWLPGLCPECRDAASSCVLAGRERGALTRRSECRHRWLDSIHEDPTFFVISASVVAMANVPCNATTASPTVTPAE